MSDHEKNSGSENEAEEPVRPVEDPVRENDETAVVTADGNNVNGNGHYGDSDVETMSEGDEGEKNDDVEVKHDLGWRLIRPSTLEKLGYALDNKIFHDILFKLKNDEELTAHRTVLMIASSVFESIFMESPTKNIFPLLDIELEPFKTLVQHIYTGEFNVTTENACGVLEVGKMFEFPDLVYKTGQFLIKEINEKNAISFYQCGQRFLAKNLEESAFSFILSNFWAVVQHDDFLNTTYDNLCKFLETDEIAISELEFFNAVMRWAESECGKTEVEINVANKRVVLKDALNLIRFPLIPLKEFALHVVPKGILTPMECLGVFQYLALDMDERESLDELFCVTNPRKKLKISNTDLLVKNLQAKRLRVKIRPCERYLFKSDAKKPRRR